MKSQCQTILTDKGHLYFDLMSSLIRDEKEERLWPLKISSRISFNNYGCRNKGLDKNTSCYISDC